MSQTPLPEQFDIERRTTPLKRTAERDEMAEYLEDHWNSGKTITEIAELSGYSRQHAVNTIESHFRKNQIIHRDRECSLEGKGI